MLVAPFPQRQECPQPRGPCCPGPHCLIGKIHPHSQWWTWPWTWGKCSHAQVTEGWPLYSFLPGAPLVSEVWPPIAVPHAHMCRGGGCQGPCVWASGGWHLSGQWVPLLGPAPRGQTWGRRQQQKGSVLQSCPRLGRACWPEMSIRWRDADPCQDAGLLGFRDKNVLLPGLRPVAGKYWEFSVWHKGLQVSYFSGGTFLSH